LVRVDITNERAGLDRQPASPFRKVDHAMSVPSKDDFKAKLVELYGAQLNDVGQKAMRKALCAAFSITGDDVERTKEAMYEAAMELVNGAVNRASFFFSRSFSSHVQRRRRRLSRRLERTKRRSRRRRTKTEARARRLQPVARKRSARELAVARRRSPRRVRRATSSFPTSRGPD
jgi:hypothetical protein